MEVSTYHWVHLTESVEGPGEAGRCVFSPEDWPQRYERVLFNLARYIPRGPFSEKLGQVIMALVLYHAVGPFR